MKNKKGQVWIENVVYILIGLTLITVVLSLAFPQINKLKDKTVLDQTLTAMQGIDKIINDVKQTEGNLRIVEFKNSKGNFYIDGESNQIKYVLEDTRLELSEVDLEIDYGDFKLLTTKYGSKFAITVYKRYDNLDFTFEEVDEIKTLQPGVTPYKISIENLGSGDGTSRKINFAII